MSGSGEELRVEVVDGVVGGVAEDGLSQDGVSLISNHLKLSQRGLYRSYIFNKCKRNKRNRGQGSKDDISIGLLPGGKSYTLG